MPRPKRPPRLVLKKERSGNSYWHIRDGERWIATGCPEHHSERADKALTAYKAKLYEPVAGHNPAEVAIGDVLLLYTRERISTIARPKEFAAMVRRLNDFWGGRVLSDVGGATCREYARHRGAQIAARNELSLLRAAINFWHKEHMLTAVPRVTLPPSNPPRQMWLKREEVARLLWAAWRASQVMPEGRTKRGKPQVMKGGPTTRRTGKHLARFILIGFYTGTRPGAILNLYWTPNTLGGHVDLERGVLYRMADGERRTRKRKPPTRIPSKLLAHLRRWKRLDDRFPPKMGADGCPLPRPIVHWHGMPVKKIHKGFRSTVAAAGLNPDVTPHVLRHTRATLLMHAGTPIHEVAASLGMTVQMLEEVYGHTHPDFQKRAAEAY